ncbi:multidrug transporter CflA [Pseudomonas sp. SDI]|uniref:Bcr/CflA family efflux MFS transporter n=1 Tax=Pseudomonas sp. SDI TaxID=2170734 RepID=UPI000DE6309A|nr:Bcr/CflA family efflux MFS transporter [Pseudomonas sp. SDI]PWB31736.1 multidrug transporter CflA [Pseudomonas sp. SDI]
MNENPKHAKTIKHQMIMCLLLLMSALGVFPLDVILPSFPALGIHFSVQSHAIAMSISLFALGVAVTQLLIGPLSDYFGRKRLLLLGLLISLSGAVGCLYASQFVTFVFFRIMQAAGCGFFVLTQALVQDIFVGKQRNAIRIMQTTASGVFISLSPLLGSYLQSVLGWSGSFSVFSALVCLALILNTTLLDHDAQSQRQPVQLFDGYRAVLRDRHFLSCAIVASVAFASHFSFIAVSPLLFMEHLGLPPENFSLVFLFYGLAYLIGGAVARALNSRLPANIQMLLGLTLIALAGITFLLWVWVAELSIATVLVPMIICTTGASLARPAATTSALERHPERAGTAAALLSTLTFATGAGASSCVALFNDQLPLSLGIAFVVMAWIGCRVMLRTSRASANSELAQ